ncbi:MAG: beta-lactamase family protein [Firmicutes bacterium]|nr:beta-lactamase family protein [Bacillota bacterium]
MKPLGMLDAKRIQQELDYWQVPGMAIGVIRKGQPDEIQCFGYRDLENGLKVDENTVFCIASCSKAMNAAMICALADEGILDLDEPVTTYAPELTMWDPEATEKMTLRDMLCHRTGLAGYDIMWPDPAGRGAMAERMRYLKPNMQFREKSQYSNLVYAMAGYVAERASGKDWHNLMQEYIFNPLGMTRTTSRAEAIMADENHAKAYQILQDGRRVYLPFWPMDMAGPAATVNSTVTDMLKWVHFHLSGGKTPDGRQLISPELFRQMHQPQIAYADPGRPDEDAYYCDGYALGWRSGFYRNHPMQKHTGKIEGYSTIQTYFPDDGLGMVILINLHTPANPIFYPLIYSFADDELGFENPGWVERFHTEEGETAPVSAYTDCFHDLTEGQFEEELLGRDFDGNPEEWLGSYSDPGYGPMRLGKDEDGRLWLAYRDQELEVVHWGGNHFFMEGVKADTETFKVPVTLIKEDNRFLVSVWYEPLYEPVRFIKEM